MAAASTIAPHAAGMEKVSQPSSIPDQTSTTSDDLLAPARVYTQWQWFFVCITTYSAALLYGLDTTIVADIQTAAVETFGSVDKLGWLGIGFPLGSIATILPIGKAYGTWDVKWLFIGSLTMFAAGSALCGAAPSMEALIIGRVWAGAGGAGMYLGILNIISINTTLQERPVYMSISGIVWGLGAILGPVIGGVFADSKATWRWAFYINLVLFALCSPIYVLMLRSHQPQPGVRFIQKLKNMDWLGSILNAAMYTFFVMVFTLAGSKWAWNSRGTISFFVLFAISTTAFAICQTYSVLTTSRHRLFPVDFLRRRTFVLLYIATSASAAALFVPLYYIPLYFSFVHNDSAIDAAVRLLPFVCLTIASGLFNGALMPKYGYYVPWFLASGIFTLVGGACLYASVNIDTPTSHIYGFSCILGIGAGLAQHPAYSISQAKVHSPDRIPDAVGFINSAQIGAIVMALTITSTIFQNVGFTLVREATSVSSGTEIYSSAEIRGMLIGTKSAAFDSIPEAAKRKAIESIVVAISDTYLLVIVAGSLLILTSFLMRREKLFMQAYTSSA